MRIELILAPMGEGACTARLARPEGQAPLGPIDIVEAQQDNVLCAKAKTREAKEDRAVPPADSAPVVGDGQDVLHVRGRQARWQ